MGNSSTKNSGERTNSVDNPSNLNNSNNNNNGLNLNFNPSIYSDLYKGSKSELVIYLSSCSPLNMHNYLLYLKNKLYNNSITEKEYIKEIEYVFYLSTDIPQSREAFASLSKQLACSKVWGPKTMFYRCKTCALSPNSSICYDCFKKGNHEKEGHDYQTSFGSFGGSCDCGSVDSWKKSGFCSDHNSQDDDPVPTTNMKPEHLLSTHLVFRHLLLIVMEFQSLFPQKKNLFNHICQTFFEWVSNATQSNRVICYIFSEELCYQSLEETNMESLVHPQPLAFTRPTDRINFSLPDSYQPPMEIIMLMDHSQIVSKFSNLFLYLLCEYRFKFGFAQTYVKIYPQICRPENVDIIFKISPQLFSVSSITTIFSVNVAHGFIQSIFSALFQSLGQWRNDQPLEKHHIAIVSDIRNLIQHTNICRFILFERPDLLKNFFDFFQRIDHLDSMKRARREHIVMDGEDWSSYFQVNLDCKEITLIMTNCIQETDSKESIRNIIKLSSEYARFNDYTKNLKMYEGVLCSTQDLFDGEKSVSLLLPQHRFVGLLLHKCLKIFPNANIADFLPKEFDVTSYLTPFILCQLLSLQAASNYWVRNGEFNMRKRVHIFALFFSDIDIPIIQMMLSTRDFRVSDFIIYIAKEFKAVLPFNLNFIDIQGEYLHRFQHFLKFMIILYQDRLFSMKESTRAKYHLIQILAKGPQPHSDLESLLIYIDRDQPFEDILQDISVLQPATVDHAATFRLKDEYWKNFNQFIPSFIMIENDEPVMNFLAYKKSKNLPFPESLPLPPILMNDFSLNSENSKFFEILHSDYVHFIITNLLFNYSQGKIQNEIPMGINESLYFLSLSIRDCNLKRLTSPDDMQVDSDSDEDLFNSSSKIPWDALSKPMKTFGRYRFSIYCILQRFEVSDSMTKNTLQVLLDLLELSKSKNLYLEKKEYIVKSLEMLCDLHPEIASEITSLYPEFNNSIKVNTEDNESKKLDAKKRQAEIMAKFIKQQNQFLEINSMNDDDDYEDKDDMLSPKKSPKSNKTSPILNKTTTTTTTTTTSSNLSSSPNLSGISSSYNTSSPSEAQREDENVCILCLESRHTEKDPLCLLAYSQVSSLLQYSKITSIKQQSNLSELLNTSSMVDYANVNPMTRYKKSVNFLSCPISFHNRTCSHYIHHQCYESYFNKISTQYKNQDFFEDTNSFRPKAKEILCPMCRRIANLIIPLPINNNDIQLGGQTLAENLQSFNITTWIADLKSRYKLSHSQSSSNNNSSSPILNNPNNMFYLRLIESLLSLTELKLVSDVTPNALNQILARNIEFLEYSSRAFGPNGQYLITTDLFNRDMLTIYTYLQSIKSQPIDLSTLIKMIKGSHDISILSMDPLIIFIGLLLNSFNYAPSQYTSIPATSTELNYIIQFSLQLFSLQFCFTQYYANSNQNGEKKSLQNIINYIMKSKVTLLPELERSIEPFLRCIYLTLKSLNKSSSASLTREDLSNLNSIKDFLGIPSQNTISFFERIFDSAILCPVLGKWYAQMETKRGDPFFVVNTNKIEFIDLPNTYEEFVVKNIDQKCQRCKSANTEHSAICLVCGGIVCLHGSCCYQNHQYEGYSHTLTCGTFKVGFFLESRLSKVTILRDHRRAQYSMLYLDQYGEPDPNLERGKTLTKSDFHLRELINSWITHSLEDRFLSISNLTGRLT